MCDSATLKDLRARRVLSQQVISQQLFVSFPTLPRGHLNLVDYILGLEERIAQLENRLQANQGTQIKSLAADVSEVEGAVPETS
jgi:hypothetical protein